MSRSVPTLRVCEEGPDFAGVSTGQAREPHSGGLSAVTPPAQRPAGDWALGFPQRGHPRGTSRKLRDLSRPSFGGDMATSATFCGLQVSPS